MLHLLIKSSQGSFLHCGDVLWLISVRVLLSIWNKLAQESAKLPITIPRPEFKYFVRGHHQSNMDIVVPIALLNLTVVVGSRHQSERSQ